MINKPMITSLDGEQRLKGQKLTDIEGCLAAGRKGVFRRRICCWRDPKFVTSEVNRAPVGFSRRCCCSAMTFKRNHK